MKCRFCSTPLNHLFADLGMHPLCESYIAADNNNKMEPFYPLRVYVCPTCKLVQLDEYVTPDEIFSEYAYFSSFSDDWLHHAERYTELMIERFNLDSTNRVVEVASNDGYLLQYFVARKIPVLGIEPAKNIAKVAVEKGIPTETIFFGRESAQDLRKRYGGADLLLGNNVMAQVPDLNSFVEGLRIFLADEGIITIEFPHLKHLVERNEFDTIYHEHFWYFSLLSVKTVFEKHGLKLFDVDELPTHGGSLRIYATHQANEAQPVQPAIKRILDEEHQLGYDKMETYEAFHEQVKETKRKLIELLISLKRQGKSICGYGAPGKGNTLLNYCGLGTDFLDFTVDRNPYKQGQFLPGTHIPIYAPKKIFEAKPDYVLVLPWNFKEEIIEQMAEIRQWGGQFIIPIPEPKIVT